MSKGLKFVSASALALSATLAVAPGVSQAQTSATPSSAPPVTSVGEVVVTAQKRHELLRNVPSAVTAVPAAQLQANGQISARDLSGTVPGLQVGGSLASGEFVIRGISSGQDLNPTVATQIDGAPIGPVSSGSVGAIFIPELDPSILQRVEVLRGPQGTLYGAATLGGIVNYVTQQPSLSTLGGSLYAEDYGTERGDNSGIVRGSLNLPLLRDRLALQVSGFDDDLGGYISATQHGGKKYDFHRSSGGRVALRWQASPDLNIQLSNTYSDLRSRNDDVTYNAASGAPTAGGLSYSQLVYPEYDARFDMTALNVDYDLHWAVLSYAGSYQTQHNFSALDYASGALTPIVGILPGLGGVTLPLNSHIGVGQTQLSDKATQEVRLASSGNAPLRWIVGLFYNQEQSAFLENIGNYEQSGAPSAAPLYPLLKYDIYTHLTEVAAFGNVTYAITPVFDVTGGLRVERVSQDYRELFGGSDAAALNALFVGFGDRPTPADSGKSTSAETDLSYLFSAQYHIAPHTMAYARFATGNRPGGPNFIVPGLPATYKSDQTYDYEVGLKTNFWDDRGYLDLNAFYIDWKNIQILTASEGLNGETNGGGAVSKGIEASVNLEPVHRLNLAATLTYTDAELTADIPYEGIANGQGAKGDPLPSAPKWAGSLSADYSWPLMDDWQGFAGGSVRYVGDRDSVFRHSVVYTPYRLPSYVTADVRAGVRTGKLELTAFVRNLGDERAQVGVYTTGGTDVIVGRPRSYGVSVGYKF